MESGKLSVTKSGKGKIIVELLFEGKKGQAKQTIQDANITDTALNGKDVEFERDKGQIVKVICEGNVIYEKGNPSLSAQKPVPQKNSPNKFNPSKPQAYNKNPGSPKPVVKLSGGKLEMNHILEIKDKAKAPYNFIPLNEKMAEAEPIPDFDEYDLKRLTGWIDLEMETKTPLYIRDALNQTEMKQQEAATKENPFINPHFFSPGGKPKIPGSSVRGMIRTLVEIAGYGRFGAFDDKGLYFRGLADKSNLRFEYQAHMSPYNKQQKKSIHKMNAGFLFKVGFDYFIHPASGFKQIPKEEARKKVEKTGQSYNPFNFYKVDDGWVVVSGHMQGKKKEWLIFPAASSESFQIPDIDIRNYKNDSNRSSDAPNMLEKAGKMKEVPCFYVRWSDNSGKERVSFGHTGMFRLAYKKSIGEHIPIDLRSMSYEINPDRLKRIENAIIGEETDGDKRLKRVQYAANVIRNLEKLKFTDEKEFSKKIDEIVGSQKEYRTIILKHTAKHDIPAAIFGNAETFAGRVFFEDALLKDGQQNVLMNEDTPKLLQTPKPTTFQHYLVQPEDNLKARRHYNDNSAIRGNKLYWHKAGNDWIERDQKKRDNKNLATRITPVKSKTKFAGRIRFENLSKVELGALLFALDLPQGCVHKLGMGKPIGLGSVKITPELHLSDRNRRYEDLFFEWEKEPEKKDNLSEFKNAFEKYVFTQIDDKAASLWDTKRLNELKTMLNFEKGRKLEAEDKIRYMEIEGKNNNEFKDRPILPLPGRI